MDKNDLTWPETLIDQSRLQPQDRSWGRTQIFGDGGTGLHVGGDNLRMGGEGGGGPPIWDNPVLSASQGLKSVFRGQVW